MKLTTSSAFAILCCSISLLSCKSYEIDMSDVHKFKDNAATMVPTARSVQAKAEGASDEPRKLLLIVGVGSFYNSDAASKQDIAIEVGQEALTVFGDKVANGEMVYTQQAREHDTLPNDAIVFDMKIDSLRQAMQPKK
jgi:hypothetical protein